MNKPHHPGANALLAALPAEQQRSLLTSATRVSLRPGELLADSGQPIEHVYFPITAVLSVLSVVSDSSVETAVIGYEGTAPLAAFHLVDHAVEQVVVQVRGDALRIPADAFRAALADIPALQPLLHRYSAALFTYLSQTSACIRQHTVLHRCARRLLTTHDRVPDDDFDMTHLFFSRMLAVRRSTVTVAFDALRAAGAITYTRGRLRVVDREALCGQACACYDVIRRTYDRLLAERPGVSLAYAMPVTGELGAELPQQ